MTPAENRAHSLLEACCTPAQWEAYLTTRTIPVVGCSSGQRYTIYGNIGNFNVRGPDDRAYCLTVDPLSCGRVPWEDVLVVQKLLLESDERRFLARANRGEVTSGFVWFVQQPLARPRRVEDRVEQGIVVLGALILAVGIADIIVQLLRLW